MLYLPNDSFHLTFLMFKKSSHKINTCTVPGTPTKRLVTELMYGRFVTGRSVTGPLIIWTFGNLDVW